MSNQITFTTTKLSVPVRKLKAKWTVDVLQDLSELDNTGWGLPEETGVIVLPWDRGSDPFGFDEYKVVAQELKNGKVKVLKDSTKKTRKGRTLKRETFESRYFEDAL